MSDTETTEHTLITDQAGREASGAHRYGRYLEEFEVGATYCIGPPRRSPRRRITCSAC